MKHKRFLGYFLVKDTNINKSVSRETLLFIFLKMSFKYILVSYCLIGSLFVLYKCPL
jgi:hypothetical protein